MFQRFYFLNRVHGTNQSPTDDDDDDGDGDDDHDDHDDDDDDDYDDDDHDDDDDYAHLFICQTYKEPTCMLSRIRYNWPPQTTCMHYPMYISEPG